MFYQIKLRGLVLVLECLLMLMSSQSSYTVRSINNTQKSPIYPLRQAQIDVFVTEQAH